MRPGRLSFFAAASWLVPFFVFIVLLKRANDFTAAETARGHVSWGLPPGFGRFIFTVVLTGGLAFTLGLVSFLRRERLRWIAAIPCLGGGLLVAWIGTAMLWDASINALRPRRLSPDLIAGILLALVGVIFLAGWLPKLTALLAREQEADDLGDTGTATKVKAVKLFGIATLVAGIAFILLHAFDLL